MLDRITAIRVVREVARLGSFSAAGRELRLSTTMVCRYVDDMEARLKVPLFRRSTRQVAATEFCHDYLSRAGRIVDDLDAIETGLREQTDGLSGHLRIGICNLLAQTKTIDSVMDFRKQCPEVKVTLCGVDAFNLGNDQEFDVTLQLGPRVATGIRNVGLFPTRGVVCAAPEYLAARGEPDTTADLIKHDCICLDFPENSGMRGIWAFETDGTILQSVAVALFCNSWTVMRQAALAGVGLAYVPTFLVNDDISTGDLIALPLDVPMGEYLPVCASFRADNYVPKRVKKYLDLLQIQHAMTAPVEVPALAVMPV